MFNILLLLFFFSFSFSSVEKIGLDFRLAKFENQTIKDIVYINCNFDYSSFQNSTLINVHFINSSLSDVNFNNTKLKTVTFHKVKVGGSKFQSAEISSLRFIQAWAPKLSFWKAKIKDLKVANSNLYALDLSEATVSSSEINNSNLTDSFLILKNGSLKTEKSSLKNAILDKRINVVDQVASMDANILLNEVKIIEAPIISDQCLKKYPIAKPAFPKNGISVLTNGETEGASFNACLKKMKFVVSFDLKTWPKTTDAGK